MSAAATTPAPARRRPVLRLALAAAALAVAGYALWWALVGRWYETTDDAYVSGDIVQVTSAEPGIVTGIAVDDTQAVARGQVLVELDDADALVQREHAEAQLARTVRTVRAQFAQYRQAQARLVQTRVLLRQAQDDLARRRGLVERGAVGGEELAHLGDAVAALQAQLDGAGAALLDAQAPVDRTTLATHPAVLDAAAAVRDAALALRRSRLQAPVAGTVALRSVQVGAHVAAGERLLAIVPLDGVWVDANFKETQLERMRLGQAVELSADVYGGYVYHGRVAGLSAGSGSAFALIPPQNASGNWIKVVQRLPVRILVEPAELREHPLRQGLSIQVKVDVHDGTGALTDPPPVRNIPIPRRGSDGGDAEVEARIRRIIQANSGDPAAQPGA